MSAPLQNQLLSVLVRNQFHPGALADDLKQAFLQVCISENNCDAMRFHWLDDLRKVGVLRFAYTLFGLSTSPFLLGATEQHLSNMEATYLIKVEEIRQSLYMDDLILGGETVDETVHLKESCKAILSKVKFQLHK